MKNDLKEKFAFTLAEVLITLGIIGIVSAMTIPTLINNYQKKVTVTRLQKAFSTLSQAVKLSEIDNGPVSTWNFDFDEDKYIAGKRIAETYFLPYLRVAKTYEVGKPVEIVRLNGDSEDYLSTDSFAFTLNNGIMFYINPQGTWLPIIVDLNADEKPNIFSKDVFVFYLFKSGLTLAGVKNWNREQLLANCSPEASDREGNYYCGMLIKNDGWQIKDDYPW